MKKNVFNENEIKLLYRFTPSDKVYVSDVDNAQDGEKIQNKLVFNIANPNDSSRVIFENEKELTPEDELPGIDDEGFNGFSRFYIYFPYGNGTGDFATKEEINDITVSVGPDNPYWYCRKKSHSKYKTYWTLFPKKKTVLDPHESVAFILDYIISTAKPGLSYMYIQNKGISGYKDGTNVIAVYKQFGPKIEKFNGQPVPGTDRESAELIWKVKNADYCTITPGDIVSLPLQGTKHINPPDQPGEYKYTLNAFVKDHGRALASQTTSVVWEHVWKTKASMIKDVSYPANAEVNGKVYVIGGLSREDYYHGGEYLNLNQVYDPVTNEWVLKAPMPTARLQCGIGVINGKIYVVGGMNDGSYLTTIEMYDPVTDRWTTMAPMLTPRATLVVGVVNGKIYAIGGGNDKLMPSGGGYEYTPLNIVEVYDPITNTWTQKAPIPTPRARFAVGVIDNKIYAIGGIEPSHRAVCKNEVYDLETDCWTVAVDMPRARTFFGIGVIDGMIYALGGSSLDPTIDVYNPKKNEWSSEMKMVTPREALGIGVVDNNLYVLGGHRGDGATMNLNEVLGKNLIVKE
ncbi:MAG: hypothetical protein KAX49_08075 [Halanaerobiales bacterium]|nr:hypothetical protein [Halanaerobiales bacterium]